MAIRRATFLLLPVALSLATSAQDGRPASKPTDDGSGTVTTPEQLRRAAPPPKNASSTELEQQGDLLRLRKAYADALDYYRAAIARGPQSSILHNKAGIAELQMLRYDQARKDFERALRADRQYPEAYNNLGVVYYIQKKYKKAIRQYQKAIELREDSASFHSNLGTAYFARKQYERASSEYVRAMQIDPEIFERQSTGGISAHMSSPEDRAHYHYVIAKMYARFGDPDRCLLYLRKAIEEGYANIKDVYKEQEFAAVRKDPRFTALMESKTAPLPD